MSVAELMQELQAKQVTIESAGERLRFRAPKRLWTSDLEARVKAAKPEILRILKAGKLARIRGENRLGTAYSPDVCWHCRGELHCACALCGQGLPGQWRSGQYGCCLGSGFLTWGPVQ